MLTFNDSAVTLFTTISRGTRAQSNSELDGLTALDVRPKAVNQLQFIYHTWLEPRMKGSIGSCPSGSSGSES